jgi:hypothetical protein
MNFKLNLRLLLLSLTIVALNGESKNSEIYVLPEGLISFDTASLFALASYCAVLYEVGHKKYDCGEECAGASVGTHLQLAYIAPISKSGLLITYNHNLKSIFFQSKGMQELEEIMLGFQIVPENLNENSSFGHAPGIKLHPGFRKINEELRMASMPALLLLSRKYPDYKIVFVGHSLGGGLALLAAVDFYELHGNADRISVYSFGKPRIGNKEWAQYVNQLPFKDRIFRLTRYGDPLPLLPPRYLGYEQEAQGYQLQIDGRVLKCKNDINTGESRDCSFPVWEFDHTVHSHYFKLGHSSCAQSSFWQRYNIL